ncbi:hypothetical protein Hdeb2414_s0012g00385741 [Helianthus debilis subsp. tardiflorus]
MTATKKERDRVRESVKTESETVVVVLTPPATGDHSVKETRRLPPSTRTGDGC